MSHLRRLLVLSTLAVSAVAVPTVAASPASACTPGVTATGGPTITVTPGPPGPPSYRISDPGDVWVGVTTCL